MKKLFLFSTLLWNIELNAQCTTTTFGPKSPATATDGATGTAGNCNSTNQLAWSVVANVYTANSSYANYSTSSPGISSHYIKATNFGFSIPTNYRITGIQVDVLWYQDGTVSDTRDCSIRLMKNSVLTGTDKYTWTILPSGPTYKSYGSASDVWGSSWTATDINNINFGVAVAVGRTNNSLLTNAHVDHIRITVTGDPRPVLTNPAITNVTCNGGNDGSASVTASGGLSPYTFSWNTGPVQTTSTATGLSAGTYTVIVADANGCTNGGTTATISEPTAITTTVSNTNVSCNGGNNGSATVTAGGGTPFYTYSWNSGQTTSSASGLSFGNYTVTVTDSKGCIKTGAVSITQPTAITVTTSVTNANCGSPNGTASASASGGTPSYTYSWSNGQTTTTATGLSAGSYTITVTDNNSCTKTSIANVSNAGSPTMTVTSTTSVSCNGGNNGSASVTASGGVSPYTYLWCNGQTTTNATGLSANCNVTITDAVGCVSITPANIPQPTALTTSFTSTAVTCNGGNDGSATVNVSGGTSPYSYSWNNGQTTATATNLSAGSYTVIVTDANSCTKTATVTISQPNPLSVNITSSSPSICNGSSVTLSAGFGYSSYFWSSGQTTVSVVVSPTVTTTYSITVSDVNGCTGSNSTMVTVNSVPTTPNVFAGGPTTFCQGDSVSLFAPIGYTSYLWSTGQTTTSISVYGTGNYMVTVSNAQGCTVSSSQTPVMVNPLPSVSLSLNPDTVCISSGMYALTGGSPSGGTYSGAGVSGGNFNPNTAGAGIHTITYSYTDGNNCTITDSAQIFVDLCTDIQNIFSNPLISIIPNPSNGIFVVNSEINISRFEIISLLGEKNYSSEVNSKKIEIDFSKHGKGIYFYQITSENKNITTGKLIIQ